jgi:hypothetical protein
MQGDKGQLFHELRHPDITMDNRQLFCNHSRRGQRMHNVFCVASFCELALDIVQLFRGLKQPKMAMNNWHFFHDLQPVKITRTTTNYFVS